ncbi:hypothetical protein [Longitalea arenae]|uniref:hypothetical protein n=1 Tax=Longitalea arenae TaxID=2812558 RepID=UPI0019678A66|nr:hypothetical protein [Longitalea arenae]
MLKSLPLLAFLPFLASCFTYQYATLSSNEMGKNDKNEFIYENDSFRLVYNFHGAHAPVNITIENKLAVPVYVDWLRSAMIVNNKTVSYAPNEMKISGSYHGGSYNLGNRSGYEVNGGHIHANATLPPSVDFMPPKTFLTKSPLVINTKTIDSLPDTAFHRFKYVPVEGMSVTVKRATFTETSSPLRFRSFLTIMVGEPGAKPQSIEHSFYVSEIMNTGTGPATMMLNGERRGNQFYSSKTNPGAGVAVGAVALGVLVGAAAQAANNTVN